MENNYCNHIDFKNQTNPNLFHFFTKQNISTHFTTKHYPELSHFRSKLDHNRCSFQFQPYTVRKKAVIRYKATFLTLGAIFFVLANVTFFKTLTWSYDLLFGTCNFFKGFICSTAGLLSIIAFSMGFLMRTEKETILYQLSKAKQRLNGMYLKKKIEFGIKHFFSVEEEHLRRSMSLKQAYQETYRKILESKDEALFLSEKIAVDPDLTGEQKENLFNQTALEFIQQTDSVIEQFQMLKPPKAVEKTS
ncbi:putative uncharacterized protein [Parachlamydia acanthamoebae UV-7]|jgi:hypothetical protein|uniref:Uncharacterized protein n=2 Tax=Parachlamydia acanthamoebae TaxID=83552 RepID=F8KYP5_PARAV|nr:hypothetical protein [Parachlamydia acanthamoebae]EFB41136.1 hypothetical protein pah_c050o109 [Parachlamydia acanthamoebae str. Hall's coccus]CCB86000.1 putative uncharacterized protein [Parachlamydia acanthamoebae UV-7]